MKYLLSIFFITLSLTLAYSNFNNKQLNDLEEEINDLLESSELKNVSVIDQKYGEFINALTLYKKDPLPAQMEEVLSLANELKFFFSAYNEIKLDEEMLSSEYFDLSALVFNNKQKLIKIYTESRKSDGHYGGNAMTFALVHKKHIFEPVIEIYNKRMLEVKNAFACNYSARIEILRDLLKILNTAQDLRFSDGTKDLEKQLRKTDDLNKKIEMILKFNKY